MPSGPHSSMQIHDFAQLSENTYHVYHNVEDLRGEPHAVAIRGEDDVHVTEGVYKRPLFLQPTYRYQGPALQGPGVLGTLTWGCSPAGPQPHQLQVGLNGMQGWGMPGCVVCLMGSSPSPGRYHRLPLPEQGAPLETQFDAFVSIIRVSGWRGVGSMELGDKGLESGSV